MIHLINYETNILRRFPKKYNSWSFNNWNKKNNIYSLFIFPYG